MLKLRIHPKSHKQVKKVLITFAVLLMFTHWVTKRQFHEHAIKIFETTAKTLQWCPESKRKDFSMSTFPEPYLVENKHVCSSDNIDVVFLVSLAPGHFSKRMFIRQTWGKQTLFKPKEVRVAYMLGRTDDIEKQQIIDLEHFKYNDIVQGKFNDTYLNLIDKTVMGLRWASENCMHSKLIVKIDDDVFVNMFKFLADLKTQYVQKSMNMFCYARPIGDSPVERWWGKWKIGYQYFPGLDYFPFVHCNGWFTAMTTDLLPVLYSSAMKTPVLRLDDVWLTGILPAIIGNVTVSDLTSSLTVDSSDGFTCLSSAFRRCGYTAVLLSDEVDKHKMWINSIKQVDIQ